MSRAKRVTRREPGEPHRSIVRPKSKAKRLASYYLSGVLGWYVQTGHKAVWWVQLKWTGGAAQHVVWKCGESGREMPETQARPARVHAFEGQQACPGGQTRQNALEPGPLMRSSRWCSILGHRESLRFQFSTAAPFATIIAVTCAALHTPSSASARVSLYSLTPCIPVATACWCHRQLVAITARIRDTAVDSTTHSRCASGSPTLSRSLS